MILQITKEQFVRLQVVENDLMTAYKAKFIRGINTDKFKLVRDIYVALTDSKEEFKLQCGACVINLFTKMGRLYFNYIEEQERLAKEKAAKPKPVTKPKAKTPAKKKVTKPKTTKTK